MPEPYRRWRWAKAFQECAEAYMEAHSQDYSNDKRRKQWAATLETYAYPVIGKQLVSDITMRSVLYELLQDTQSVDKTVGKLWHTKIETAKRLLGRIKTDSATVNEYRTGTNPMQWTGHLDTQLPSPTSWRVSSKTPRSHAATWVSS